MLKEEVGGCCCCGGGGGGDEKGYEDVKVVALEGAAVATADGEVDFELPVVIVNSAPFGGNAAICLFLINAVSFPTLA